MAAHSATSPAAKAACARALGSALADTYILYLKTQNFHWNVKGPRFRDLHQLFEEQYRALWRSVDDIAERIRALDEPAPGTHARLKALAMVRETEELPDADAMLRELTVDNETLASTLRTALAASRAAGDEVTAGVLTARLAHQEKQLWMMKSMLAVKGS